MYLKQAYFHKLKAYRFPQRVHRLCLPPRALPLGLYGSQQGFLGFGGQVLSRLARYKRRNERLTMQSYPTKYTHIKATSFGNVKDKVYALSVFILDKSIIFRHFKAPISKSAAHSFVRRRIFYHCTAIELSVVR